MQQFKKNSIFFSNDIKKNRGNNQRISSKTIYTKFSSSASRESKIVWKEPCYANKISINLRLHWNGPSDLWKINYRIVLFNLDGLIINNELANKQWYVF